MIYPDPLPFKLKLVRAVTEHLKGITPANGYVSDLSDFDPGDGVMMSRVYRGRMWFGDNDPIPMVSMLEGTSPADDVAEQPEETPTGEYWWSNIIQGFVDDDPANPTDPAYILMADVRRRLIGERKRKNVMHTPDPFGLGPDTGKNCIIDLRVGPGVVRPADDVSAKAWFWLSLDLRIVDNAAEPYA